MQDTGRIRAVSLLLNLWIAHLTVNKKESRFPQSSESDALPEQQIPEGVLRRQRLFLFKLPPAALPCRIFTV